MDAQGHFKIESVNPTLVFTLLVVADAHEPGFFKRQDPLQGHLDLRLSPRANGAVPKKQLFLGRVVGPDKTPVAKAVVIVQSYGRDDSMTYGSPPDKMDPLAVTSEKGEFEIHCPEPFDFLGFRVDAEKFARASFEKVALDGTRKDLVLHQGSTLKGRVVKDGKAVSGITIGAAGTDRSAGAFVGDFVAETDTEGRFEFSHLPASTDYAVYGVMDSLQGMGALPTRIVKMKGEGTVQDVGTWELARGFRLAGQVKLADGKPIPAYSRLVISRTQAWNTEGYELPSDGRFDLKTLPGEQLEVSVALEKYRLAAGHASQNPPSPGQLIGQLQADKTNLVLLLEPGERLESDSSDYEESQRISNLPLAGMEERRAEANLVEYGGQVTDAATGSPVAGFTIIPGLRQDPRQEWTEWMRSKKGVGTNGGFNVRLRPSKKTLVFLVEADGYVPVVSRPLSANEFSIQITLKRGIGPQGKVRLPDGQPASNIPVLFVTENENAGLDKEAVLNYYSGSTYTKEQSLRRTAEDGRFSFPPKLNPGFILAASTNGFAMASQETLKANPVLVLQPWAQVSGRLLKDGKPVTGEALDLRDNTEPTRMRGPWISYPSALTDAEGRFQFKRVPPTALRLTARAPIPDMPHAWSEVRQCDVKPTPGAKTDLGDLLKVDPPVRR